MISATVSISQQYLLASKARSKLVQCASTEKNKDYDLRILVGHANLLDKLMDNIDTYTDSQKRKSGSTVDFLSSDDEEEEEEEEEYEYEYDGGLYAHETWSEESSDSESDEETLVESPSLYYGSTPHYSKSVQFSTIWEEDSEHRGYVPLRLGCSSGYSGTQSGEEQGVKVEEEGGMSQDLSMVPMVMGTKMPIRA